MKIGILLYPTYGGSGVVATELGMKLAQLEHQVHFITYRQPFRLDPLMENIYYHEVRISDYPLFEYPPYELVLTSKIVDVALYEKLDLLHVHYAIPHASAAYMAKQILKTKGTYLPVITTLHGTDITLLGKDESFEPVITFAINQSDEVTAVSYDLKEETCQYFDIQKNIKVIYNFVDIRNLPDSPYINEKEKILIHVSNFRKLKRVEDVIKVFDIVRKKIPSKLYLVGDGPERNKVEKLCRKLNACNSIKFFGKVKNVETLLHQSDVFLIPSAHESFGLAALEAMASFVPVVSSNAGGLKEINQNGVSGFLCNVKDIECMANRVVELLSDNDKLLQFKINARKQAEKFDVTKILPQYLELYEETLKSATGKTLL
ncbi:MAG: N-acetyl-alpha-D-glucosaminyl L-malate synthase BshA [Bacteroidetes bacterium]|nr:MAG: N-acetyl-alpha-D-glucosaminyl L-malate synthase BshA [Bacteroidota bacterium]